MKGTIADEPAGLCTTDSGHVGAFTGLTKREYFASQALNLWQMEQGDLLELENGNTPNHRLVAKFCVELADALIEALNDYDKAKDALAEMGE